MKKDKVRAALLLLKRMYLSNVFMNGRICWFLAMMWVSEGPSRREGKRKL